MASSDVCLICREGLSHPSSEYSCVGQKGLDKINEYPVKHNNVYPENPIPVYVYDKNKKFYVHIMCRKDHTNERRYPQTRKRALEKDSATKLRSDKTTFSFRTDCFLCGKTVDKFKARKHPSNQEYEYSSATTLFVKETITKRCAERRQKNQVDEWADAVSHRMLCIHELPAEEAIYHRKCFQYLTSPRNLSLETLSCTKDGVPPIKRGRPSGSVDERKNNLEKNDDETITLDEPFLRSGR